MNIKQRLRIKMQQISVDIFSYQTLSELTGSLFWFVQTNKMMQKGIVLKIIIYQKVLQKIIMSSSMEKTVMTNQLILI